MMDLLWETYQNSTNYNEITESDDGNINYIELLQRRIDEIDEILKEIERFKRYAQYDNGYIQYDKIEYLFDTIGIPFDIGEKESITIHNGTNFQNIAESDIHIYTEDELWVLQVIS